MVTAPTGARSKVRTSNYAPDLLHKTSVTGWKLTWSFHRMNTVKAELAELQTVIDLKPMLVNEGPCLSVYLSLSTAPAAQRAKTNSLRWKEVLGELQGRRENWGAEERELLESVSDWNAVLDNVEGKGKSVAVFRSKDIFRISFLQEETASRAEIGPEFYIRPLLPELTKNKLFYILALSQNNVRMLRCTLTSSEEVPLTAGTTTSFNAYQDSVKPDHDQVNRASAGPSSGSSKGAVGTTNTERETKDEYLSHFFKQINTGVNEVLRGKTEPIVLAGVDYELSLYKRVNSYPHLSEESVHGAPNSLKSGEMHARAIEALAKDYEKKLDKVLAEYDHKVGGGASNRLKDVVTATHDGRVLTLVVSDSLTSIGTFDEATNQAIGGKGDQDLVNDAAVQTILHAGNVLVAPNSKMPHGSPLAAVFRY